MQHNLGLFATWDEVVDALRLYSVGHTASVVGSVTDGLDDAGFWAGGRWRVAGGLIRWDG